MLFINNPEARTAIIEQTRRDNGQHLAAVADVTPASAPHSPRRTRIRLGYRLRAAATN